MIFNLLNLDKGGGFVPRYTKEKQGIGATLAIGLGGLGIAAVSKLKAKVYQQVLEDNPGAEQKTYGHIQFLGIDADNYCVSRQVGAERLDAVNEFFSINEPAPGALFAKKKQYQEDWMNWIDSDLFKLPFLPDGTCGIRQMGRLLFLRKYREIRQVLTEKIRIAHENLGSAPLNVYIFSGLSGGTGSGCFVDMCYLVRKVLTSEGIASATIHGLFFLPDVVISNSWVDPAIISYNKCNGYAALKELNYLMNLKGTGNWLTHKYSECDQLCTQEKPVDVCCLISGRNVDNSLMNGGPDYAVSVAAEYALSFLLEPNLVTQTPIHENTDICYMAIGAVSYELPFKQITAFLTAQYFRQYSSCVRPDALAVTAGDVQRFAKECLLDIDSVTDYFAGSDELLPDLEEYNHAMQNRGGTDGKTQAEIMETMSSAWLTRMKEQRKKRADTLFRRLDSYDITALRRTGDSKSLTERVFYKIYELSINPAYGPYYAAALLKNDTFDIHTFLSGEIENASFAEKAIRDECVIAQKKYEQVQAAYHKTQSNNIIYKLRSKKYWLALKEAATELCVKKNAINIVEEVAANLASIQSDVDEMYTGFIKPMLELLENIQDTCNNNMRFLDRMENEHGLGNIRFVLPFKDIRDDLRDLVSKKGEQCCAIGFIQNLFRCRDAWISGEESNICKLIQDFISDEFRLNPGQILDNFLEQKHQKNNSLLSLTTANNVLQLIFENAGPLFWCRSDYLVHIQELCALSVPVSSSSLRIAAEQFKDKKQKGKELRVTIREKDYGDRCVVLRLLGLPLEAYGGLPSMKAAYDSYVNSSDGAGVHLYSAASNGCGLDWQKSLPELLEE